METLNKSFQMNNNKELNSLLENLFSSVKNSYGIASMIKDIKEKEVGNKDYEIMSYKNLSQQKVYIKTSTDKFVCETDSTYQLHMPFNYPNLEIYSVRRKSDSEIFTQKDLTDEGIINSFYEELGQLWIRTQGKGGVVSINEIQKVKAKGKDYEILNVRYKQNDAVIAYSEPFYPEYWDIYSVKRLGDNKVFTIGEDSNCGVIIGFNIVLNNLLRVECEQGYKWLHVLQHKERKPLFTTEDGKEIFEDNECWYVRLYDGAHTSKWSIDKSRFKKGAIDFTKFKFFSTEDKAKEYVLMNKPCLSIREITNNAKYVTAFRIEIDYKGLKELAQQKINNQ